MKKFKIALIAVSVLLVLSLSVNFLILYTRKPFRGLTASKIESVVVYQSFVPDDDSYVLSNDNVDKLTKLLNNISVHIYPATKLNSPKLEYLGGPVHLFKLKNSDGSECEIGVLITASEEFIVINNRKYSVDSSTVHTLYSIEALHSESIIIP